MRLLIAGIVFSLATLGFADTITLKNGTVINGTYLGGSARQVRIAAGDNIQTLDVTDIQRIEFGSSAVVAPAPAPAPVAPAPAPAPVAPAVAATPAPAPAPAPRIREDNVMRPQDSAAPPAPAVVSTSGVVLPAGTNFVIRMIDSVDSETARVGQSFAASLDQPVMLNGDTIIPRGADVTVKLVDAQQSGKLTGRTSLALSLQSVRVSGQMVDINTQTISQESGSRTARTAKVAGGTAALGAIIGAIAGGGTGAAIGAGAGAAAGAGAEIITSGQRVRIPSETRLTFVLDNPVRL